MEFGACIKHTSSYVVKVIQSCSLSTESYKFRSNNRQCTDGMRVGHEYINSFIGIQRCPSCKFLLVVLLFALFFSSFLGSVYSDESSDTVTIPEQESPPRTADADRKALLEVRDAFGNIQRLNWNESSDPCDTLNNGWSNIACSCEPFGQSTFAKDKEFCDGYEPESKISRVIYLDLKPTGVEEEKYTGPIPKQIGRLTKLRILKLEGNDFTGTVPNSFKRLKNLRYLSLAQNKLTGKIPEYFGSYTKLKGLNLHENNFSGDIPESWCNSSGADGKSSINATISLHGNRLLCGKVPDCVAKKVPHVNETNLYHTTYNRTAEDYGECDTTAPICNETLNGCNISVPQFWNNMENITFNFTNFEDVETNISHYTFNIVRVVNATSNDTFLINDTYILRRDLTNVTVKENTTIKTNITYVSINVTAFERALDDGTKYKISLTGHNKGVPKQATTITSEEVFVDFSEPTAHAVYIDKEHMNEARIKVNSPLCVSWNISDEQSNISRVDTFLEVQSEDKDETGKWIYVYTGASCNVTEITNFSCCEYKSPPLKDGSTYRFRLVVTNGVGLHLQEFSGYFTAYSPDIKVALGLKMPTLIIVVCVIALVLILVSALVFYYVIWRKSQSNRFNTNTCLKKLAYELSDVKDTEPRKQTIKLDEDVAIVVTDMEGSTEKSVLSKVAFNELLKIHNKIARSVLAECCGLETATEGDSFIVVFPSVVLAMSFALDFQDKLQNAEWSKDVLRLRGCAAERDENGELTSRGPRVREGIHWGKKSGIRVSTNPSTGARLFHGEEFDLTKAVCNAGHGGQILLTHQAWLELNPYLSECKFPTIRHLGVYDFNENLGHQPLYEVYWQLGKPKCKFPKELRQTRQISEGEGICSIPFPRVSGENDPVTFVAIRMVFYNRTEEIPVDLAKLVFSTIYRWAQLFQGAIVQKHSDAVRALLAFRNPIKAMSFAHITQVSLVLEKWPSRMLVYCGPSINGEKNICKFHGPRIAMAIHTTADYKIYESSGQHNDQVFDIRCSGEGEAFTRRLAESLDGGQIVLSESTWQLTQDNVPGKNKVIDLGKHKIDELCSSHMILIEITPLLLEGRNFKEIKTYDQSEKGYHDAPSVKEKMAIVFLTVQKSKAVEVSEHLSTSNNLEIGSSESVSNTVCHASLNHISLPSQVPDETFTHYTDLLQSLVKIYDGYQFNDCDKGECRLAFAQLQNAINCACFFQMKLKLFDVPEELSKNEESSIEYNSLGSTVLRKGLCVRIGIAYGFTGYKQSTRTGRADYTGALVNLCSRLKTQATPGQILIHCENGLDDFHGINWLVDSSSGYITLSESLVKNENTAERPVIEIIDLGGHLLRGMLTPKRLYEVKLSQLSELKSRGKCNQPQNNIHRDSQKRQKHRFLESTTYLFQEQYRRLLSSVSNLSKSRRKDEKMKQFELKTIKCHDHFHGNPDHMTDSLFNTRSYATLKQRGDCRTTTHTTSRNMAGPSGSGL